MAFKLITPYTIDGNRLYDLTPNGKKALGKKVTLKGRGGLEHRYYVEKIKEYYINQGGFTFIEKDDIDLVVDGYENRTAIQVETGKSDIMANLFKIGRYRADKKFIISTNPATDIKIKEILKDLLVPDKEKIQVISAKDFLGSHPLP